MIVYGDPHFTISAAAAGEKLRSLANPTDFGLAAARNLLIAAGQIEQAIADSGEVLGFGAVTDAAATVFLKALRGEPLDGVLAYVKELIAKVEWCPRQELAMKIPEGYAFYCLYPEQYFHAALEWMNGRAGRDRALVVGIRSIGTSLSALVKATLDGGGFAAERITVRPTGHPFERAVSLPKPLHAFSAALVVDGGPGLSGSSMAAVAKALKSAGVSDITFLPGHAGSPGAAASEVTRRIWRETPRLGRPMIGNSWHESSLYNALKSHTERLLGARVTEAVDVSGGSGGPTLRIRVASPRPFSSGRSICCRRRIVARFCGNSRA